MLLILLCSVLLAARRIIAHSMAGFLIVSIAIIEQFAERYLLHKVPSHGFSVSVPTRVCGAMSGVIIGVVVFVIGDIVLLNTLSISIDLLLAAKLGALMGVVFGIIFPTRANAIAYIVFRIV